MIGERLKEVRGDHGDTQHDLAEKLNVSQFTVQSWEQGKSSPSHEFLVKICKLYEVSADFLLGLSDDDPVFHAKAMTRLNDENRKTLKKFEAFLLNDQRQAETKKTELKYHHKRK